VRSIVERLGRVETSGPADRVRIEGSLGEAFRTAEVQTLPIRWVEDPDAFFIAQVAAEK
jgi:hypothetical protein